MSELDLIPLTFLVPPSTGEPMVIELIDQPLRMVVVDKQSVGLLGKEWDIDGLYFLFGSHEAGLPKYTAYVGKSPAGLRGRITSHVRTREEPWDRALLMTSAANLDSTAIGWLEGRLHGVLDAAVHCHVTNKNTPGDNSLPAFRRNVLEQYVAPITAAMRALGYSPDTPDQLRADEFDDGEETDTSAPGSRDDSTSVADLVRRGLLAPGATLRSRPAKWDVRATVTSSGSIEFEGDTYASPSMAAVAATGSNWNGWEFWGIPSGDGSLVALNTLRDGGWKTDKNAEVMLRFWERMFAETDVRGLIGDRTSARKTPWLGYSIVSGVEYNFVIGARKSRVELLFRRRVRHLYDSFVSEYREALPPDLQWTDPDAGDGQARVYREVAGGRHDDTGWGALQANLVDELRDLRAALDAPVAALLANANG